MRDARRALRAATRARRRYERAEVRRFTVRSRARRRVLVAALATVVVLAIMLSVALFSPILSLRHIEVQGTHRLDATTVSEAVDGQLGTPLALVDLDRITQELGDFPLVQSYTTEVVPPGTLVIDITEREPVGAVEDGTHWNAVDAAGVTVSTFQKRPSTLPVMTVDGGVRSAAFRTAAAVLTSVPSTLKVHSVAATTTDDVELVLTDGTRVVWGSDERPRLKGQVLAALMKTVARTADAKGQRVQYDVSSPDTASFRIL